MNQTTNYQLNQYELTDKIEMQNFNADNAKIDAALKAANDATAAVLASAGNCKITTGTYTGTGVYGASNPNTLTFNFQPKLVIITMSPDYRLTATGLYWYNSCVWTTGCTSMSVNKSDTRIVFTQTGHSLQWYYASDAMTQLNTSGTTYRYIAIG